MKLKEVLCFSTHPRHPQMEKEVGRSIQENVPVL